MPARICGVAFHPVYRGAVVLSTVPVSQWMYFSKFLRRMDVRIFLLRHNGQYLINENRRTNASAWSRLMVVLLLWTDD